MQLLNIATAAAMLAGSAYAHSWLECVDTKVSNYDAVKADPTLDVEQTCNGYPRNKIYNGDWLSESSNYAYNFAEGTACSSLQSSSTYDSSAPPRATATPGQNLLLRFWGNGHSRWDIGSPNHRDPGLVRIYWAGKKDTEIEKSTDLNEGTWIKGRQANFSGDAVTELTATANLGMQEKANWMEFELPTDIENGNHVFVWAWAWKEGLLADDLYDWTADVYDDSWTLAWGTCFDVEITGSSYSGTNTQQESQMESYTSDGTATSEKDAVCSQTCYQGGMTSQPCTGSDCPPCWFKNDGVIGCYAYTSGTTCPFTGAYDCSSGSQTRRSLRYERDSVASHLAQHKHKRHNH